MELLSREAMLTAVILMVICSSAGCAEPHDVRLVDGSARCDGAVEVFYNGDWRRMRGDQWTKREAAVVCRQLDCGSGVAAMERESERDRGEQGISFDCQGSESALSECRIREISAFSSCAASVCSDSMRLVDGPGVCSGRLEVKSHQSWTTVCEAGFDWQDAEVVCRELDCGPPLNLQGALFGEGKLPFGTKEFQCNGTENRLLNCSTSDREENTCTSGKAVGLTCSEVRLVDGSSRCDGAVEVFHSGSWRRVRGKEWTWEATVLVCRELDCGSAIASTWRISKRDEDKQGVSLDCNGSESALSQCSIRRYDGLQFYAVSICSEPIDVRLVNGSSRCDGTVEVFTDGDWRKVMGDVWTRIEAAVVCRQLDCGSAVAATKRKSERDGGEQGVSIDCGGSEPDLSECGIHKNHFMQFYAASACSGILVKPIISFSAPISVSRGLQGPEVLWGHSFTITCSTQPQYPGGSFHLKLPWKNRNHTQSAVNHSASFLFPAADDSHQGNYSCVYENQEIFQNRFKEEYEEHHDDGSPRPFNYNFSSESEPLSLIITGPLSSTIINIKLLVFFVMLFLMLIICLTIFLIVKTRGYFFIRNTPGAVQKTVSLQSRAEEQQNVGREAGEKLPIDLKQEKD
ncbi:hypothetical protein MHYP_G00250710 [Metynnis hypsauchen]